MMEYYQIKKENQEYIGVRLFRFDLHNDFVTQIVTFNGHPKRGKGHYVGIYFISKEAFLSNYLGYYVEKCTKAKFDKTFKEMCERLK